MSGRVDGKVAIVTGGAGSIGLASAAAFVREGASVMLVDLDADALDRAGQQLGAGDRIATAVADVTDAAQVEAAVAATAERFGRLDIVFANAGMFGTIAPVKDYPEDVFRRVIEVNVTGTFLTCKHVVPSLQRGASIVINSSVVGLTADPTIAAYATSKHALVGLMRVLAKELAPEGIRVNTIHPGPTDNDFQHTIEVEAIGASREESAKVFEEMIPLSRHATPEEIGNTVLFLASDESAFMTGATVAVDGGMSV